MSAKGLLDTGILLADPGPYIDEIEHYCSSNICRAELAAGRQRLQANPARHAEATARTELLRLLDSLPAFWVDFDRAASDQYAALNASTGLAGARTMIAAQALARDLTLITTDEQFTAYPQLRVNCRASKEDAS